MLSKFPITFQAHKICQLIRRMIAIREDNAMAFFKREVSPVERFESALKDKQAARQRVMRPQRVWKPVGPVRKSAEIERLYLELAAFNERIQELEKQHPEASKIEALRVSALALARQIDEICCSSANDLTDLLAK